MKNHTTARKTAAGRQTIDCAAVVREIQKHQQILQQTAEAIDRGDAWSTGACAAFQSCLDSLGQLLQFVQEGGERQ